MIFKMIGATSFSFLSYCYIFSLVSMFQMALYEKNSYVCVCAKGYTGEHCETGET